MAYKVVSPCHENWDTMAPSEKGRYCDACRKHVLDLTGQTDQEVPDGSCGRIISPVLQAVPYKTPSVLALGALASAFFAHHTTQAQNVEYGKVPAENGHVYEQKSNCGVRTICLSGKIRDKGTGEDLSFANVMLKQGNKVLAGVSTDIEGIYKIEVSTDSIQGKSFDLMVVYLGYDHLLMQNIPVSKSSYVIDLSLSVSETELLGMIIYEEVEPVNPWPFDGQSGKFIDNESYKHMPK